MGNKRTRKGKNNFTGGVNANVYDNIISSMTKLNNDIKNLGTIIENIKNSKNTQNQEKPSDDRANISKNEESTTIPEDILVKIEEQKQEMNDVLEDIDEKEEKIQQESISDKTNNSDEKLEESKEQLQNDIKILTEQINEGVEDTSLLKNKQRNRSFYSTGRTWSQWFYGFVEYYNELKSSLTNIIENRYYNSILRKPANERTQTEKVMIEKVNNLEIELTNMNKTIGKGGFRRKKYTRKNKK